MAAKPDALGCESKSPRTTICRVHLPVDKAHTFEPLDDVVGANRINSDARGQSPLVNTGGIVERSQDGVFHRGQAVGLGDFR